MSHECRFQASVFKDEVPTFMLQTSYVPTPNCDVHSPSNTSKTKSSRWNDTSRQDSSACLSNSNHSLVDKVGNDSAAGKESI